MKRGNTEWKENLKEMEHNFFETVKIVEGKFYYISQCRRSRLLFSVGIGANSVRWDLQS